MSEKGHFRNFLKEEENSNSKNYDKERKVEVKFYKDSFDLATFLFYKEYSFSVLTYFQGNVKKLHLRNVKNIISIY